MATTITQVCWAIPTAVMTESSENRCWYRVDERRSHAYMLYLRVPAQYS